MEAALPAVKGLVIGVAGYKGRQQANSEDVFQQGRVGAILQPLSANRMEKSRKVLVGALLFTTSVAICLAQHWSYGLQPGGKRNAENLVGSFQEVGSGLQSSSHFCYDPLSVLDASKKPYSSIR
uniref:Progonadoliberin-1 n=1 Tax=Pavo cristatus TaxID=9049 RepID=A0A8C9G1E9_PAVCR